MLHAARTALATSAIGLAACSARVETEAPKPDASAPPPAATASASVAPPAPSSTADAGRPEAPPEPEPDDDVDLPTLEAQRERLFQRLRQDLGLSDEAVARVRAIFAASPYLGQGNPTITRHPMKRAACRAIRRDHHLAAMTHAPRCGSAPNMLPIYDTAAGQTAASAPACIDRFEFPDIACEYPVVYARASEAAALCAAVGKRICDAHEWEGACAGALHTPSVEYHFDKPRPYATWLHNKEREITWSYGKRMDQALCATGARKSEKCDAGGWTLCGSNTYPAGAFPACVSRFGIFDLNGNAAEHMNLALAPEELASRGGSGATEMKGSWFVFAQKQVHEDDCRWRAKDWHPSKLADPESHRNYHLGFRCCKDGG